MVADGRFRQDLYYRISAFPIHLPALRERLDDIPMLVASFLQRAGIGGAKAAFTVDPAAMAVLQAHAWPGNIRELRNVLERARLFADDGVIRAEHLSHAPAQRPPAALLASPDRATPTRRRGGVSDAELVQLASRFAGTRKELAAQVGLSERTLYRKLQTLEAVRVEK